MGNNKSKDYIPIKEEKFAKISELVGTDIPCSIEKLHRFSAYGDNISEAIKNLTKMCQHHGVPIPIKHPVNGSYYCGYVKIMSYGGVIKNKLNPVMYKEQNGRYLVYFYYTKL